MKILKYITIQPGEAFNEALNRIKIYIRESRFTTMEQPQKLTGNQKVLKLISKDSSQDMVKIDGPGFVIDELFDYFIKN